MADDYFAGVTIAGHRQYFFTMQKGGYRDNFDVNIQETTGVIKKAIKAIKRIRYSEQVIEKTISSDTSYSTKILYFYIFTFFGQIT